MSYPSYKTDMINSEAVEIAKELKDELGVNMEHALDVATKLQYNRIMCDALMLHTPDIKGDGDGEVPPVLERIAMELGASRDRDSLKNALYEIAEKLDKQR